jgi:hypothetical protein
MGLNLAPRIAVRQVVLGAAGKLSAGTITPASTPTIPNGVIAADVVNTASWTFTDRASGGVGFPVAANEVKHMPGSFVRDTVFAAGTYVIVFYLAG